jgi:HlyD family secretion protein
VEEGEHVEAGQVLATQDPRLLRAQLAAAAAEVDARRAALARLEAGARPEELRKARADVAAAAAGLREAEASARRIRQLVATGAVDQQRADDATSTAEAARARWEAARATLDLTVAGPRAEDLTEARAVLARAQAERDLIRERLDDTRLRAPHDGIVRERILEPGDIGSPDRPVFVLAIADPVWVRAYAPEPMLGRLREGMPAEVRSDSFPDKRYQGWLGHVSPTAEFTPKTVQTEALRTRLVYQVRILVCNPQGELRLGMPVSVHLDDRGNGPAASTPTHRRCVEDTAQ